MCHPHLRSLTFQEDIGSERGSEGGAWGDARKKELWVGGRRHCVFIRKMRKRNSPDTVGATDQ